MSDILLHPRVGPSGNSESFYEQGFKQTVDTFSWQREHFGLDAFEIPFGRGISMSKDTARAIDQAASLEDVSLSVHAPYYINLANPGETMAQKSTDYILNSARLLKEMDGQRLVVHVGSPKGQDRAQALTLCGERLLAVRKTMIGEGLGDIRLCLETMGRLSVLGTLEEIIHLVALDDSFVSVKPTHVFPGPVFFTENNLEV